MVVVTEKLCVVLGRVWGEPGSPGRGAKGEFQMLGNAGVIFAGFSICGVIVALRPLVELLCGSSSESPKASLAGDSL